MSPDLLERNFSKPELNRVWTGNMKYVRTNEGWLYLAVVIDLFSTQNVGFGMHERMTRQEAKDEVMDWLKFYNRRRLHSTLGYLSPMNFEKKHGIRKAQLAWEERNAA